VVGIRSQASELVTLLNARWITAAIFVALGAFGFLIGRRIWWSIPASEDVVVGLAPALPLPSPPAPPLARLIAQVHALVQSPTPVDATATQEDAFREHPDAMMEVRTVAQWRVWDLYEPAIDRCGQGLPRQLVCWHRLGLRVPTEGQRLVVTRGHTEPCKETNFATTGRPATNSAAAQCVEAAIGEVDGVIVPSWAADALRGYNDTVDIEVLLEPRGGHSP
jgi:hypothetical protein